MRMASSSWHILHRSISAAVIKERQRKMIKEKAAHQSSKLKCNDKEERLTTSCTHTLRFSGVECEVHIRCHARIPQGRDVLLACCFELRSTSSREKSGVPAYSFRRRWWSARCPPRFPSSPVRASRRPLPGLWLGPVFNSDFQSGYSSDFLSSNSSTAQKKTKSCRDTRRVCSVVCVPPNTRSIPGPNPALTYFAM